ncbi:MAG: hypothetical protein NVS9B7_11820 [Flavisolibacter sp.]
MMTKMYSYLQNLIQYVEQVLYPPNGGSVGENGKSKKKKVSDNFTRSTSPESFNLRGGLVKKQEKIRRNPAP